MFDVVGIGECCVDLVGIVHSMPKENSKKDIFSFRQFVGGSTINALLTLSNLNLKTSFIGAVGNDEYGQFIKKTLEYNNVDIYNVKEKGKKTPFHFVILSKKNQSRTIFKKKESIILGNLTEYHKFTIKNSKILLVDRHSNSIGLEAVKYAKKNKVLVAFDPSDKYNKYSQDMISLADIFIAPDGFIKNLKNSNNCEKALMEIWNINKKTVVLTLGPEGCIATDGKSIVKVKRYSKWQTIDTNGAGDVFHGAFLFGVTRHWSLLKTCEFANKIAALKCSIVGNDFRKLKLTSYVN
jgi:sulfofructose kinase